jgi:AcrR family transcriptional regulator
MRAVTHLAGVSVSAANYHFGSKEALLLAALKRRLGSLNEQRLQRLDALLTEAAGAPVPLAQLMDAFLRPTFEALQQPSGESPPYRLLAARLYTDPHEQIAQLKTELFGPVSERFVDALAATFCDQPREELLLRFHFVVGVLIHAISGHCQQGLLDEAKRPIFSDAASLDRMVAFATAGLQSIATPDAATTRTRPGDAT